MHRANAVSNTNTSAVNQNAQTYSSVRNLPTSPSFGLAQHTQEYTPPTPYTSPPSVNIEFAESSHSQGSRVNLSANSTRPFINPELTSSSGVRVPSQNSTVMNETLSVINEHITDMHNPGLRPISPGMRSSLKERRRSHDSGSDYSSHTGRRLSYITGEETDQEEQNEYTRHEVSQWSPARVAQYLEDNGVEKQHCDVFLEQEFSGEVLLDMEMASIFLKELDLGPVGRRLKTWQKIKALQDEVNVQAMRHPGVQEVSRGSSASPSKNRSSSTANSALRRISPVVEDSGAYGARSPVNQLVSQRQSGQRESPSPLGLISISATQHNKRPSAASIRSLGHSRRHSSIDQILPQPVTGQAGSITPSHSKRSSFDRSWTMNGLANRVNGSSRPKSSAHIQSASSDRSQFEKSARDSQLSLATTATTGDPDRTYDRGYVSSGEGDAKLQRRPLKKDGPEHYHNSSHGSEKRMSFFRRKSRPTSPERTNDFSTNKQDSSRVVSEPIFDLSSPTFTKLDYERESPRNRMSAPKTNISQNEPGVSNESASTSNANGRKATRAVSDAVTGREKAIVRLPVERVSPMDQTLQRSPTDASASAMSVTSKSIDFDDAKQSQFSSPPQTITSFGTKRKSKQDTSAYIRGLEKKSPQQQMLGCEFSGWMKKKSSNIMASWKPRLFVLRGRRLSYYYSENDTEEKGLIDISNHRVLPADNDHFTTLRATVTRVTSTPTSPHLMSSSTFSSTDTSPRGTGSESNFNAGLSTPSPTSPADSSGILQNEKLFIFKLVPPRSGLSKAVNFTKPTVHYFAASTVAEGRLWMAALVKATIDRDESLEVVTTYQQKTISLEKARARRERPPALRGLTEEVIGRVEEEQTSAGALEGTPNGNSREIGDGNEVPHIPENNDYLDDGQMRSTDLEKVLAATTNGGPHSMGEGHSDGKRRLSLQSMTRSSGSAGALGLGIDGLSEPVSPLIDRSQEAI